MKEVLIHSGPRAQTVHVPIPTPNASQVVIQVVVSGSNPKDWKMPEWFNNAKNQGDDIAGIVASVGEDITEFKPGDRVAAFHEIGAPGGSFAEYAVAWGYTTFHIPKTIGFEEAATLPLAFMAAALGLYYNLRLPIPWHPVTTPTPLIIYGGATAVGAFAIKLAVLSNIHPIIAIAGRGASFVETLIDRARGDDIVDYRNGNDAIVAGIRDTVRKVGLEKIEYAFDATTAQNSWHNIANALDPHGAITFTLFDWQGKGLPETLRLSQTHVGCVHQPTQKGHELVDPAASEAKTTVFGPQEFGHCWFRLLSRGLLQGWMTPHPFEVIEGGLDGVETALKDMKAGKNSAVKYVLRIADVPTH